MVPAPAPAAWSCGCRRRSPARRCPQGRGPAEQLAALHGSLILGALSVAPLSELGVEDATDVIVRLYLTGAGAT